MHYVVSKVGELKELEAIVPLFDAYRQFYRQSSDVLAAKTFLVNLFEMKASTIFVAYLNQDKKDPVGFVQLYPMYSSVVMKQHWVLNDLYVKPDDRKQGVATALLSAAHNFVKTNGGDRLTLKTEKTNRVAKRFYEHLGYTADEMFDHYTFYFK